MTQSFVPSEGAKELVNLVCAAAGRQRLRTIPASRVAGPVRSMSRTAAVFFGLAVVVRRRVWNPLVVIVNSEFCGWPSILIWKSLESAFSAGQRP